MGGSPPLHNPPIGAATTPPLGASGGRRYTTVSAVCATNRA